MIGLPLLYLGLLASALKFLHTKKIIVGIEAEKYPCPDCLKFRSILEGMEYSFLSNENITLELIDLDYIVEPEDISHYLMSSSNRSLIFKNKPDVKSKSFFLIGTGSPSRLSRIIFHGEFFSLDIINIFQIQIENIHFVFLGQKLPLVGCLVCLNEIDYAFSLSLIIMNNVHFECASGATIYLDDGEFSLLEVQAYEFSINLFNIKILMERIGYFKNFLKISGVVPQQGFMSSERFIGVKYFEFLGNKSLTLVRNIIKNLNASFESSFFENVKVFEINASYATIHFKNCSFFLDNSNLWSIPNNLAKSFLYNQHSNLTIESSNCRGVYLNSNENYIFFVAERSQAFIYNFQVYDINIGEVGVSVFIVIKN
jgi:hypothetical protein